MSLESTKAFDEWVDMNDPGLERTGMTHEQVAVVQAAWFAGADHERDACHDILSEHCDLGGDVGIALGYILARGEIGGIQRG